MDAASDGEGPVRRLQSTLQAATARAQPVLTQLQLQLMEHVTCTPYMSRRRSGGFLHLYFMRCNSMYLTADLISGSRFM